jgi:hypothetical protein
MHIGLSFGRAGGKIGFALLNASCVHNCFRKKSRSGRRRWLHVDEMPFSRAITYKLIEAGLISSVVVTWPGSRRGRRLIDGDSLDSYLEGLTAKAGFGRHEIQ